jgi:hypothetical protein
MTATDRVRKHRAKLREEHCRRLDVWIASWIVERIRQLAKRKGRETWSEVQDVLEQHLVAHGAVPGAEAASFENEPGSALH